MAILASFPLSRNDQADVIEIFNGLTQQLDLAAHSSQVPAPKPISSHRFARPWISPEMSAGGCPEIQACSA